MADRELEILYQALGSPLGLEVQVSDFKLASQRFYTARRKAGDPSLDRLQFRRCPSDEFKIWIVKGPEQDEGA